jgi:hypothetical protein
MGDRKTFPLRLDPAMYDALQRWAGADLRSLNAQIEFLLRRALREAGRLPADPSTGSGPSRAESRDDVEPERTAEQKDRP